MNLDDLERNLAILDRMTDRIDDRLTAKRKALTAARRALAMSFVPRVRIPAFEDHLINRKAQAAKDAETMDRMRAFLDSQGS